MRHPAQITLSLALAVAIPDTAYGQARSAQTADVSAFTPPAPSIPPSAMRVQDELRLDQLSRGTMPPGGGRQIWRLPMRKGQAVRVDLASEVFDTYLEIYARDRLEPLLANDDNGLGSSTNSRVTFTAPEAGNYYISANRILGDAPGSYEIIVRDRTVSVGATCLIEIGGAPQLMRIGTGASGGDEAKSCFFTGSQGLRVRADTKASFDSSVELKFNGERIGFDDDSGGGGNARLVATLRATGRYELLAAGVVRSTGEGEGGKPIPQAERTINLTLIALPLPKSEPTTYLFEGTTCSGTFTADNAVTSSGGPYAYCELTGNMGDLIRVTAQWIAPSSNPSLSLRVGMDTPLGFASVLTNPLRGANLYRFARSGTVLVRVSAPGGPTGDFRVTISPSALPTSAPSAN